ncbi:hypothetical protein JaAD80_26000 [Janthinobacterium sp. AD80]|nr:hypothetical protein JaAD80_26000 [Janthinobacterium sp. AD80]
MQFQPPFRGGVAGRQGRLRQHGGGRQVGRAVRAGAGQQHAIAADDHDILHPLFAQQASQHGGTGHGVGAQLVDGLVAPLVKLDEGRIEAGAPQFQARFQRRLDLDVEPRFDRVGNKTHRDDENHQAGQDADDGKQHHQARHQLGAELAAFIARVQAPEGNADQRQQRDGHGRVQAQQPGIVAVEETGIVGSRRQQEQQDTDNAAAHHQQIAQCLTHYSAVYKKVFLFEARRQSLLLKALTCIGLGR